MPRLSRWFIKAGLFYFVFSMLLAVFLSGELIFPAWRSPSLLTPVFYHLLMVGWITQIIFGVSIWMFPRQSRERPRGNELSGWLTFAFLNLGLLLRVIAEPANVLGAAVVWDVLLLFSALLQWLAGLLYVLLIWPRIKGK